MAIQRLQSRWLSKVLVTFGFLTLGVVGIISEAGASHHRGVDDWASIDASGRVTLHARTRWRKGAFADPDFDGDVGVAPARFGASLFTCGYDQTKQYNVSVATGIALFEATRQRRAVAK